MEHYVDSVSNMKFLKNEENDAIAGKYGHRSTLRTEVTIVDYNGDDVVRITKKKPNMTVLAGRISLLEKAFGITPVKSQRLLVSDQIPTPNTDSAGDAQVTSLGDDPTYASMYAANTIFGDGAVSAGRTFKDSVHYFCIGNGGENPNTPYEILDVHNWETRLYNMVPFRCVSTTADLSPTERAKYRLRKEIVINGKSYYAYYAKVFDPGVIHSERSSQDYTPSTEDSNPYVGSADGHTMRGHNSEVYIEFDLEISQEEFKEFYRALNNDSLRSARLTELGLISAYDSAAGDSTTGAKEIYDATLFAKLVHDPVYMSNEGSRRKVSYKIFS